MFTGIIETVGLIARAERRGNYSVVTVRSSLPVEQIQIGESIACQGACLTVTGANRDSFTAEISQETAARIDMSRFTAGSRVNLERAVQADGRLGGHLMSGHIDTTGQVAYLRPVGESLELAVRFDNRFDPLVIDKGSLAVDGVSLTVNESREGWLSVNLIPHTSRNTTLHELKSGDLVNLEFDLIGKYVLKYQQTAYLQRVTEALLRESGW